ncbi:unnamed protein product [Protopolystoma xenopodis]|uniref:Uncharacterized protein n=1 Tax=Protopolystoma xenopodis TaxID=117903 RepID=A0A448XD08_9PLAT|nr:unnamed protein product [Protopolystoma xenopodis]
MPHLYDSTTDKPSSNIKTRPGWALIKLLCCHLPYLAKDRRRKPINMGPCLVKPVGTVGGWRRCRHGARNGLQMSAYEKRMEWRL